MAASDYATTLERDLRSADREFKRDKDLAAKWVHGARPLYEPKGITMPAEQPPDEQDVAVPILMRPNKRISQWSHTSKKNHNVNKPESNWEMPAGRMRSATHAKEEMQDASSAQSLIDLLPINQAGSTSLAQLQAHEETVSAGDLPGISLPLGMFIKAPGRETEKLVEKEYEVLDDNGQLLKGRKARHNLRHGNSQHLQVDEGFELL